MHFFEHQDEARRKTGLLIALFVLAVAGMIGALYGALAVGMAYYGGHAGLDWLGSIAACVIVLVLLGTGLKSLQLRGGGGVVARQLGGRLLSPDSTVRDERRVLNVVEEMAIASGMPVPGVYMLDADESINAFAAGWTPEDAAIALTRGAVHKLSRDELQGVVAHEFSHILRGDMRLNIRLMGVLFGIVMLSQGGALMMRMGAGGGNRRRRSGKGVWPVLGAGAVIWVVGSIGLFLGQLIKAAVSRQREFLADAAAVQFTRNPSGLAGALIKIGAPSVGSHLRSARTSEASHLLFAEGLGGWARAWMATHPPLTDRIRRLMPGFAGRFPQHVDDANLDESHPAPALAAAVPAGEMPVAALSAVGEPTGAHLAYAQSLLSTLPQAWREAAKEPLGAEAVLVCLLLGTDPAMRKRRLLHLRGNGEPALLTRAQELACALDTLDLRARLPLLDLCLPALRKLDAPGRDALLRRVVELVQLDGRVELFEWSLVRVLRRHLFAPGRPSRKGGGSFTGAVQLLLSFVAHQGARDADQARAAFGAGAAAVGLGSLALLPAADCPLAAVDRAVDRLTGALPRRRQAIVQGLLACIGYDGRISVREAEVFRAVAEVFGAPVPPLLPGQALSG